MSCHIHFILCRVMIFSPPLASRFGLVSREMPCPPRLAYKATVMQVRAFEVAWDQASHCGKKKKKISVSEKKKLASEASRELPFSSLRSLSLVPGYL